MKVWITKDQSQRPVCNIHLGPEPETFVATDHSIRFRSVCYATVSDEDLRKVGIKLWPGEVLELDATEVGLWRHDL